MGSTLLLVEDNEADIELALRAFRAHRLGGRIEVARDGVEALEMLHGPRGDRELPKCILLDLKLPRMDGLEVARRLRADTRTAHLPVVILTSSQEPCDVARGYELGINSYLVKPLDFAEFQRMAGDLAHYWLELNTVACRPTGATGA